MYQINKDANRIEALATKQFSELGFREREHLQEWLAANPEALGEELLIIQKEFDGFDDTRERLDLLALDKNGDLVVIENKLDDSGRDVVWQALKYASYSSSLSKRQITQIFQQHLNQNGGAKAEDVLSEFFDDKDYDELNLNGGHNQRIIFVAANFRKEVTSTALWLINHKIRIQCIKATPYALGEQLFINLDQIIPVKEAEEYTIGISDKDDEQRNEQKNLSKRYAIRKNFWTQLIPELSAANLPVFRNASATTLAEMVHVFQVAGIVLRLEFKQHICYIKLVFKNKSGLALFEQFDVQRFEQDMGYPVEKQSKNGKAERLVLSQQIKGFDSENWPHINAWFVKTLGSMVRALEPQLKTLEIDY